MEPTYLGDSVYCRFDGFSFVIYLDNGEGPHNEIALEPAIVERLNEYVKSIKERYG